MKQPRLTPQPFSSSQQRTLPPDWKVPLSTQEFKHLRASARTPEDFAHLASVCRQQADFYRLQSEQLFSAQSRHDRELITHYRELVELWTGLAEECLGRAEGR